MDIENDNRQIECHLSLVQQNIVLGFVWCLVHNTTFVCSILVAVHLHCFNMWASILLFLQSYQFPFACIFVVCTLYYFVRSRLYPPFRPDQHVIKARRDSSVRIAQMKDKSSRQEKFSEEELDVTVRSFQYAVGNFTEKILYTEDFDLMEGDSDEEEDIDWMCL